MLDHICFTSILLYYHPAIFDGAEKDSDLFMLLCMTFHKIEVSNFNIASMGEESGSRNIFSLGSMVKSSIGLERGGQVNLCYIT